MTEPDASPQESSESAPPEVAAPPPTEQPPSRRHSLLPWLCLVGFLVLAAAIAWVWTNPRPALLPAAPPPPSQTAALAALSSRLDGLAGQLGAIEKRLAALPPPTDLAPIEARLSALEKRPPPTAGPPSTAAVNAALAPLSRRIDAFDQSLGRLSDRLDRIQRLARIAAAAAALADGRPLGTLPGAPPALAQFAETPPPTLAKLRMSFSTAAAAELAVSRRTGAGKSFLDRILLRMGNLFTLREGNRVIIGNPAESAMIRARTALDAGDVSAALAALDSLPRPLAPTLAEWEDKAKALLAAQAALATLASSG